MTELDRLLMRVRDGDTSASTLARARSLLARDERLPPDLREIGLSEDEPEKDSSALLGVLGLDGGLLGGLLAEALANEAEPQMAGFSGFARAPQEPVITAAMLVAQEAEELAPVAEAVRFEAGELDISIAVSVRMGHLPTPVSEAVSAEAGEVDLAAELAWRREVPPVAAAIRAESGEVEISEATLVRLNDRPLDVAGAVSALAGRVDVVDAVLALVGIAGRPEDVLLEAPIAAAVHAEAADVDVADAVLGALGAEAVPAAAAVREEAGEAEIWPSLAPAFGPAWASALFDRELSLAAHKLAAARLREKGAATQLTAWAELGAAIRDRVAVEAGSVAVWAAVATRIGVEDAEAVPGYQGVEVANAVRHHAGTVELERVVEARIRSAKAEPAANNGFAWVRYAAVGLAAVAVLALSIGRVIPLLGPSADAPAAVALAPDFATGEEIRVEDLSWAAESQVRVIQSHDDQGEQALIIWIDEEA